jgi:hypothetical protein
VQSLITIVDALENGTPLNNTGAVQALSNSL